MQNSPYQSLCGARRCIQTRGQLSTSAGACSRRGCREANEDVVFADMNCRLFIALDGIGGEAGGREASKILLEQLQQHVETMCRLATHEQQVSDLKKAVAEAISQGSRLMQEAADEDPRLDRMGTVFSLGYIVEDTLFYTRIGDARVYLVRDGVARRCTDDESYVQLMVDVGVLDADEAKEHPLRNVILNAVGTKSVENPADVYAMELQADDVVLLTTDGVSDYLTEVELAQILTQDGAPETLAEEVVQAALDSGSQDNVSCVVVRLTCDRSLHHELQRVHQKLMQLDSLDKEIESDLKQIVEDIRRVADTEGDLSGESGTTLAAVRDRLLDLEARHPHVSGVVGSLADFLSRMGI